MIHLPIVKTLSKEKSFPGWFRGNGNYLHYNNIFILRVGIKREGNDIQTGWRARRLNPRIPSVVGAQVWINTCLFLITPLRPKQNEIRPFYKQTWQVSETCQVSIRYRGAAKLRLYK
jgi:hypothetical protein